MTPSLGLEGGVARRGDERAGRFHGVCLGEGWNTPLRPEYSAASAVAASASASAVAASASAAGTGAPHSPPS